jgi:hypothetical protein
MQAVELQFTTFMLQAWVTIYNTFGVTNLAVVFQSNMQFNANPKVFAPTKVHKTASTPLWSDDLGETSSVTSEDEPIDQFEVFGSPLSSHFEPIVAFHAHIVLLSFM